MSSLLQKLGLKRRDPDSAGRHYAQQNVGGLPVMMRRAQSEIYATGSVKWQNDALSAAPTEAGSSPNQLHYASAGSMMQSNKSVGMASDSDYRIKGLLGQGTQGKVWDAVMKHTGKAVVIKGLHKQHITDVNSADSAKREQAKLFWRAFRNEIDILESCHHPNIVKIVGRSPDYSQLMMEKADMDLNKCLKMNSGRLNLGQCSKWFKDILTGVAHLHSLGVTHTDLKPENLLITNDSQLKICDFGMAQRAAPGTTWAVTGELSTLWYRAPELLLGSKTFGEKIDEWAVGCIAMELLCGVTIFQGQAHGTCQCRDITHRNFNSDQVGKILQVVGSPLSLAGYQCAGHIKDWPKYSRQIEPVVKKYCQARRLPGEHPDVHGNVSKPFHSSTLWAQAIGALLVLSPDDRSSCLKVLQMPLFQNSSTPFAISNTGNSKAVSSTSRGGVAMAKVTPRQALTVANGNTVVMAGLG